MIFGLGGAARTDRAPYLKTVMQIQLEVDGKCRIVLFAEWVEPVKHTWAVGKGVSVAAQSGSGRQAGEDRGPWGVTWGKLKASTG
jgi:hypothetical protein